MKLDGCNWYDDDYNVDNRHEPLWHVLGRIKRAQDYQRVNDLLHASLYGNTKMAGFTPATYNRPVAGAHLRLSLNVTRNCIQTAVSKLAAKNKIKATFLTKGGDSALRTKAEGLEQFNDGVMYANKMDRRQRDIQRDACVFGSGFTYVYSDERRRRIVHERVPKWQILVDDAEAIYGDPRNIYRYYYVDRRWLKTRYPNKADAIQASESIDDEYAASPDRTCDYVPVCVAHHKPSVEPDDPDSADHDGIWCVSVSKAILSEAPWPYDRFPYPHLRWTADPAGFFGTGVSAELAAIQGQINELLEKFQRAHRLVAGHWMVDAGARIQVQHINDDLAAIVKYAGVRPEYYQPVAIPQDTYQFLWDLYAKAYDIVGISQMAATMQKPAGLNSGKAIRAYADFNTERLLEQGMNLEDYIVDATEMNLICARELAKSGDVVVATKDKSAMKSINFREIDLRKDQYLLHVYPTSMLPDTPEGKMAFVQESINSKMLDPEDGFDLLNFPDFDAYAKRRNAPRRLVERNLDNIITQGKWTPPEPTDPHELAIQIVTEKIAEARLDGVSDERVELLRNYLTMSVKYDAAKYKVAASPAPAPAPAAPVPPMGAPPPQMPPTNGVSSA